MSRPYRLQQREFAGKRWKLVEEYASEQEARDQCRWSAIHYPMCSYRVMRDGKLICQLI